MIDLQKLLAPTNNDIQYMQTDMLKISLLLRMDSYKFAHPFAYRPGITGMTSYGEARVDKNVVIVPFGMQIYVKRYLTQQITLADIDIAERFAELHFGRKLFARKSWEKVVTEYNGYLPLIIRTVREGTPIRGGMPVYSVTALGEDYFWMSSAFETMLQRAIWYPTTIASLDYDIKKVMKQFYIDTGADLALLPFALHDFGARGVTCAEQAEIGGAAHCVNFMGSDTVEGILAANFFYKETMAAFSAYATEHSVQCSFGSGAEDQVEYISHQLRNAPEGSIISIVLDGFDVEREATACCTILKDEIIASKAKVVFRPDSGDMMVWVPKLLRIQEKAFGYTKNSKGFRKINYVGLIQGDGVDHLAIKSLLGLLISYGWAADNVIFGSGGALLQKVNRDTFKFAQKASAICFHTWIDQDDASYGDEEDMVDIWIGISKDPITDPGKKSKEGMMTLVRNKLTGEYSAARLDQNKLDEQFEDAHVLVYHTGKLYNETTLVEVRARCAI